MKYFTFLYSTFFGLFICPLFGMAQVENSESAVLPEPPGPYAVGSFRTEITDQERNDLYHSGAKRKIPVKVWYPGKDFDSGQEVYLEEKSLLNAMITQGYNHQDSISLVRMGAYRVHSKKNTTIVGNKKFPLLLFSHGLGVSKLNYTLFAEGFASEGYITVMIDHPYGGFTVTDEGRLMSSRQDSLLYSEKYDSVLVARARDWARDIRVVLDEVLNKETPLGKEFSAHIKEEKIVSMGHSLGGNVALQYASTDSRVIAAVNLDGGSFGNLEGPPQVPTLTLRSQPVYSDEELKARERNRADWKAMEKSIDQVFSAALTGSNSAYEIKIKKTGHMSFSDAPFVLPDMITRFGGELLSAEESFRLIFGAIHTFLKATLEDKPPQFKEYLDSCALCKMTVYQGKE